MRSNRPKVEGKHLTEGQRVFEDEALAAARGSVSVPPSWLEGLRGRSAVACKPTSLVKQQKGQARSISYESLLKGHDTSE